MSTPTDATQTSATKVIAVTAAILEPIRQIDAAAAACDFTDPRASGTFDELRAEQNERLNDAVEAALREPEPQVWLYVWDDDGDCIGVSFHATQDGAVAAARAHVMRRYGPDGYEPTFDADMIAAAGESDLHDMLPNLNEYDFEVRQERLVIKP